MQNRGLPSSLHLFIINDQLEPTGSVVQRIRDWTGSRKAWILALAMQQHPHRPLDPAEPQTSPVLPCLPPLHGFQTGWVRKVCVVGFEGTGIKCIQVQASRRPLSSGQVWSCVLLRDPLLLVQVSCINPKQIISSSESENIPPMPGYMDNSKIQNTENYQFFMNHLASCGIKTQLKRCKAIYSLNIFDLV